MFEIAIEACYLGQHATTAINAANIAVDNFLEQSCDLPILLSCQACYEDKNMYEQYNSEGLDSLESLLEESSIICIDSHSIY